MPHWTRVGLALVMLGAVASAEPAAIGKAKIVNGKVLVTRGSAKTPVKVNDTLKEHDVFETGRRWLARGHVHRQHLVLDRAEQPRRDRHLLLRSEEPQGQHARQAQEGHHDGALG